MIIIVPGVCLNERDISFSFIHSSGPGGQNINKVATAVQARFDTRRCEWLSDECRSRLAGIAGSRLNAEGEIIITARRFRSQQRNREDAVMRLAALLRASLKRPKRRRKTSPSRASCEQRLSKKKHLAARKKLRATPRFQEDSV